MKSDIKPLMQVLGAIALFVVFYLVKPVLETSRSYKGTHGYNPSEALSLTFICWGSLIIGIALLIVGIAGIIKYFKV